MSQNYLAKHYSKLILPLKPEVLTDQENAHIQTLLPEYGKILDVGCGSGRHLIPLAKMGYQLVGVEISSEMSQQLLTEMPEAKLFSGNINSKELRIELLSDYQNYFDLIILMWNTLNELAYNENELADLLEFLSSLVTPTGKVLIQLDQNVITAPEVLNFETTYAEGENKFTYISKLISWDQQQHISICAEKLITQDETVTGEVTQKWWSFAEVSTHKDILEITLI